MAGKAACYVRVGTVTLGMREAVAAARERLDAQDRRTGPLWALVERFERVSGAEREAARTFASGSVLWHEAHAKRQAYGSAAAELADVLNTIGRGEA